MQKIHFYIYPVALLLFLITFTVQAQNGSITIENNFNIPSCKPCTTLHAVTTPITGIGGTGTYNVNPIAYNPFPYIGANLLTVSGAFNNVLDDEWSSVINLPFPFCYFNNTYTKIIVSQNGQVGFDIAQASTGNNWSLTGVFLPFNSTDINNTIMGAYFDIYPFTASAPATSNISWDVYGTAPNRAFVVSFNSNPMFGCTSQYITQQIVLFEGTNKINVNIQDKLSCPTWNSDKAIEGIQNATGTIAYTVPGRNATAWTATNDSWEFAPQGGTGTSVNPTSITWYTLSGTNLGTGDSMQVCPTTTTTYYAKATYDLCGAQINLFDTVTITKDPPLSFQINNITDANCYNGSDGSINFTVNNGTPPYSYTINGSACTTNPTGLNANVYTIVATDAANCTASTIININQPSDIVTTAITADILCKYQYNGHVDLTTYGGIPPYQYWYDNTIKTSADTFRYMNYGNHTFYTSDAHNCIDSIVVFINQPDSLLSIQLVPKIATCINKNDGEIEAIASGGVPPYTYNWNTWPIVQTSTIATNLTSGAYTGVVQDANGCVASYQTVVEQQLCCQLFLPNAFTPNNDSKNDKFHITQRGGGVILGEMRIYNRWGQEIYTSHAADEDGWDGTFKGKPCTADTYYYLITYTCNDKGIITQKVAKGDIILIR